MINLSFLYFPICSKVFKSKPTLNKQAKKFSFHTKKCKELFASLQLVRQRWAGCGPAAQKGRTVHRGSSYLPEAEKPRHCWKEREQSGGLWGWLSFALGSGVPLRLLPWGDEVKEVLTQFLIPSANHRTFLVVVLGLLLLSGWIYTVCVCMLYLDYALMCHHDDKRSLQQWAGQLPCV